jgi:hypothetical protein
MHTQTAISSIHVANYSSQCPPEHLVLVKEVCQPSFVYWQALQERARPTKGYFQTTFGKISVIMTLSLGSLPPPS